MCFQMVLVVKTLPANEGGVRGLSLIPRLGRSPRESHGQGSLVGYSPWSHKELNTTEQPSTQIHRQCLCCGSGCTSIHIC